MNRHQTHAGVQHKGCVALCNLAGSAANSQNIMAEGGLKVIIGLILEIKMY